MKAGYDYMYGSTAPKLNEKSYPHRKHNKGRNATPAPKEVLKPEADTFPVAQVIICIIITFAVFATIIYRYSTITEMNFALAKLNEEYETLKDGNRKLEVSINSKINQENIREIAEERLNMKMPDSYQKIPVKVPKVNYSTVTVEGKEEKNGFLKTLFMFLGIQ